MIGIIVQILISILLLHFIERKTLSVLGWQPNFKRLTQLIIGICITILLATSFHMTRSSLTGISWKLNPSFRWIDLGNGLWYMLKSVLYEELIFRGALFYIAIKRLGLMKGIWLSVIAFGVYHWFSYSAFGQPLQMAIIFLITASAGWMYAYAFIKTNSLYLPIGLHFGWNITSSLLFSEGSIGQFILVPIKDPNFQQNNLLSFLFMLLYQTIIPAFITWLYARRFSGEKVYLAEPN